MNKNVLIMAAKDYCMAFCEGYFYALLGERLINGQVTDKELDLAKETARKCIEQRIVDSAYNEKQKQEKKENLKKWADAAMQGFKKRLRDSGRLIETKSKNVRYIAK